MSLEQKKYLKNIRIAKIKIIITQILLISIFLILWEFLVNKGIISAFIYSSPSRIIKTIVELIKNHNFFIHIYVTLKEVFILFLVYL